MNHDKNHNLRRFAAVNQGPGLLQIHMTSLTLVLPHTNSRTACLSKWYSHVNNTEP